jgi:macrolide transport system ATP-binding/permease protein
MGELLRRIWYRVNRRRMEREMAEEMAYHRELMPEQNRPGSDWRAIETSREVWGWGWLDRLTQDLRYGSRLLWRSPGFTMTAMLVLGLGIAVPITVFRQAASELYATTAPDPATLVSLARRAPGMRSTVMSYPELIFYAAQAESFRELIGISQTYQATLDSSEAVRLQFVTPNYFREFGIAATAAVGDSALVSESFLQHHPDVVGQTIRLNGKPVRVAGVVPRSPRMRADVWMAFALQPHIIEGSSALVDWSATLDGFARLRAGVSPAVAEQETHALGAGLHQMYPKDVPADSYLEARPILQFDPTSSEFQIAATASGMVMLLLVAGCANLGILVLARGIARDREIRTRMALGAGRSRMVRQLLTESILLSAVSGAAALALSSIALKVIELRSDGGTVPSGAPGWLAVGATAVLAMVAAMVFGLPAAMRLTSLVPAGGRMRSIFLGAQVAASCLLLVISSLMVSSVQKLRHVDAGFNYRQLLYISPGLKAHGYSGSAARAYFDQLRAAAERAPGVESASVVWLEPWGNSHSGAAWRGHQLSNNHVDAHFLDTMGIRVMRGRNFHLGERRTAIVTQATAKTLWPGEDPVGKILPWDAEGATVIGLVRDVATTAIGGTNPLEFYLPIATGELPDSMLLVRTSGTPKELLHTLEAAARGLDDRLQPVARALSDDYDRELSKITQALTVVSFLGAIAVLLSAIGLAGLARYTVAQRTRELGLRMALGARAAQIVRAILAPMFRPIAVGFACGIAGGTAAAKILRSGMAGIGETGFSPLSYVAVLLLFGIVVALAVLPPARRALQISPAKALQHE